MNFLVSCLKGIALGAGAILPGVSSGVLCVVFGIYDRLVDSVLGFFTDVKKNVKFLFPIVIGVGIGVVLFGNILRSLFAYFEMQTKFAFIGLILGCVPSLVKTANSKNGFKLRYILYSVISLLIAILLLFIENNMQTSNLNTSYNFLFLVLSGFIMSIGIVVPGISSTVLLMILGVYATYLEAVSTINIPILFPMGIGVILGGIVFLKLIQFSLNNYFPQTYYFIIGFVLGSILILYPRI